MSLENKIEELERAKNAQIEKLEKMKDILKQKLNEANKKIGELTEELERIKSEKSTSAIPSDNLKNVIEMTLAEKLSPLEEITKKLDGISAAISDLTTLISGALNEQIGKTLGYIKEKIDSFSVSAPSPASVSAPQPPAASAGAMTVPGGSVGLQGTAASVSASAPSVAEESESRVRPRRPSDIIKMRQMEEMQKAASKGTEHLKKPSEILKQKAAEPSGASPSDTSSVRSSSPFGTPPTSSVGKAAPTGKTASTAPTVSPNTAVSSPSATSEPKGPPPSSGIMVLSYPKDGVIKCPKCGAHKYKQVDNKLKPIAFHPRPIYAKKYVCIMCKAEWEYKF